ncbi:response regulator transcription factor [Halomonas sp. TBZ9]|uniref:Response regulator transcription factor n=1 Tax=Vreelandella azerica TaxID=2732867 RepID=A0A7Y3X9V7_9GAMM|nr:response regulator transcription factor [Halomonas azerica]NOG30674.1 response regulator transcription factor [Halomonas azerica]
MRIAIVEDDPIAAKLVSSALVKGFNKRGFTVDITTFESGTHFISIASRDTFDVVILDWHLPDRTGIQILDWMKRYLKKLPTVVMVTQRQHEKDIIQALNEGADDFISKPFSPSVLSARVYAAYRRQLFASLREAEQTELDFGSILLDEKNEVAYVNGGPVALTRQELKLAYLMLSRAGSILSRSYLYEYVWGMTHKAKTRTLDVHIHRVRKKLSLTGEYGWNLESVYGHGYRLERVGPLEETPNKPSDFQLLK